MALNTTFVSGTTVITAAHLNGIQAAWDTYTPVATNFTVGNGSLTGRWIRIGKTAFVRINFSAGGTSSYTASASAISLPAAAHATGEQWVPLRILTGASIYCGGLIISASASTGNPYVPVSGASFALSAMSTGTVTAGTTGNIVIEGVYQLA